MYKTIIVDDEPYARQELKHQLSSFDCFDIVEECENAVEGVKAVREHSPDILFLDIQMPGMNGFDMLSMLEQSEVPLVIFVSAYDEYAIKAFEADTLDYLLKPIEPKRLSQTVSRIHQALTQDSLPNYNIPQLKKIPCSLNNLIKLIDLDEVDYIVSDITGVHVVSEGKSCLTDLTLKVLEERTDLFRCHRQYMVNLDRIKEIKLLDNGAAELLTSGSKKNVPVSRRLLKSLKQHLGIK